MSTSKKNSQEQFKELLQEIYIKGLETETIETNEMIMEIKEKLITVLKAPPS